MCTGSKSIIVTERHTCFITRIVMSFTVFTTKVTSCYKLKLGKKNYFFRRPQFVRIRTFTACSLALEAKFQQGWKSLQYPVLVVGSLQPIFTNLSFSRSDMMFCDWVHVNELWTANHMIGLETLRCIEKGCKSSFFPRHWLASCLRSNLDREPCFMLRCVWCEDIVKIEKRCWRFVTKKKTRLLLC